MNAAQARRRFLVLRALRWLPVTLTALAAPLYLVARGTAAVPSSIGVYARPAGG